MARSASAPRRVLSRLLRPAPYHLPPCHKHHGGSLEREGQQMKKRSCKASTEDWENATCSVCMEYPHNAVLLLCSSHDKGCRPYMCGTSFLYSNCLDQYKKAYTKVLPPADQAASWPEKAEAAELSCPLCRGQVKGWTVVEPARTYLNAKRRSCMQDNCSFVGDYRELRRHMKAAHPRAGPREVDPMLEQRWRRLEREREHEDVISVIRSSTPGAVVWGDYVIEGGVHDEADGGSFDPNILYVLSLFRAFENSNASLASRLRRIERGPAQLPLPSRAEGDEDDDGEDLPVSRRGRAAGRIERRRRRRRRSRSFARQDIGVDDT